MFSSTNSMRRKLATVIAAMGALVMAAGLVALTAPTATASGNSGNGPGTSKKVWVCKYVGKPGVDERLKTGKNPIPDAVNSTVGTWFNDAQGRSYVLDVQTAANTGQGETYIGNKSCPTPQGTTQATPSSPTFTDPTCTANGSATLPSVTGVVYTIGGDTSGAPGTTMTVTAAPATGYAFPSGATTTWSHLMEARPTNCTAPIPVSPGVSFTDPSCANSNAAGFVGSDSGEIDYAVTSGSQAPGSAITVTATPKTGFVLANGAQSVFTHTFGAAATGCSNPPGPNTVTPLYPTVNPATCNHAGSLSVPTEPAGVETTRSGHAPGKVTFSFAPATGYVFPAGTRTSVTLTVAPKKTGQFCGQVLPSQSVRPHTTKPKPTVLGTQAVAPTAVDAGLASYGPSRSAGSTRTLLAEGLLAGGLLMVLSAGWLGLGRRRRGIHEA